MRRDETIEALSQMADRHRTGRCGGTDREIQVQDLRPHITGRQQRLPPRRRPRQDTIRVRWFHWLEVTALVEAERHRASGAVKLFRERRRAPDDAPRDLSAGAELARRNFYSHTARHYATASREFAKLLQERDGVFNRFR